MAYAVAAYLHFVAILVLVALLVLEHQMFRMPLNFKRARSLFRVDLAFGIAAGAVLVTGAMRAMRYGKGMDYYLHNTFFHAKVGLFVAVALLSIYPTVTFLKWRPALKAGEVPSITPATALRVKTVIRIELVALLLIPLFATLMARGFGVIPV
jgi:putative membrane protein